MKPDTVHRHLPAFLIIFTIWGLGFAATCLFAAISSGEPIARTGQMGDSFGILNALLVSIAAYFSYSALTLQRHQMDAQVQQFGDQLREQRAVLEKEIKHNRTEVLRAKMEQLLFAIRELTFTPLETIRTDAQEVNHKWALQYNLQQLKLAIPVEILIRLYFRELSDAVMPIFKANTALSDHLFQVANQDSPQAKEGMHTKTKRLDSALRERGEELIQNCIDNCESILAKAAV